MPTARRLTLLILLAAAQAHPLAKDAVTADWPCFLGPHHNGVCSETKLIKTLPK